MSKEDIIRQKALEILARQEYVRGIRWKALVNKVAEETGEKIHTCQGSLYNLPTEEPEKVVRPSRGLFILKQNAGLADLDQKPDTTAAHTEKSHKYYEQDLYEPAKEWLIGEGECTHAVVIGGSSFGKKWGTPDILGAIRVSSSAWYKPLPELVAVEIKDPGYAPVEALGQAMAYKLFAHKTWMVLPSDEGGDIDLDRIKGIAITANIGLIGFKWTDDSPDFETIHRPASGNPDPEEINNLLEKLKKDHKQKFNELMVNEKVT